MASAASSVNIEVMTPDQFASALTQEGIIYDSSTAYINLLSQLALYKDMRSNDPKFIGSIGEGVTLLGIKNSLRILLKGDNLRAMRDIPELTDLILPLKMVDPRGSAFAVMQKSATFTRLENQLTSRLLKLQQEVPKLLHFAPLGEFSDVQQDYIKLWAQVNEDFQMVLWYDGEALLSKELFDGIKSYVLSKKDYAWDTGREEFRKDLLAIQEEAYKYVRKAMEEQKLTFDDAVIKFMVERLAMDAAELKEVHDDVYVQSQKDGQDALKQEGVNFVVRDLSKEPVEFWQGMKERYYQELLLKGSQETASQLLKWLILDDGHLRDGVNSGGIFVKAGVLPEIDSDFIEDDRASAELEELQSRPDRKYDRFLAAAILESMRDDLMSSLPDENTDFVEDMSQELRDDGYSHLADYLEEALGEVSSPDEVFVAFEKIKILSGAVTFSDGEIPEYSRLNDSAVMAVNAHDIIQGFLETIESNYKFIQDTGYLFPTENLFFDAVVPRELNAKHPELAPYTNELASYRVNPYYNLLMNSATVLRRIFEKFYPFWEDKDLRVQGFPLQNHAFFTMHFSESDTREAFERVPRHMYDPITSYHVTHEDEILGPRARYLSRYPTQWILDLFPEGDSASSMANRLVAKHPDITQHLRWVQDERKFVTVEDSVEVPFTKESRVIVIGHGSVGKGTVGRKSAEALAFLLKATLPVDNINRISLVSCNMAADVDDAEDSGILDSNSYAAKMIRELLRIGVDVESVSVRATPVAVDHNGRKTYGTLTESGGWKEVNAEGKKLIVRYDKPTDTIRFERVAGGKGLVIDMGPSGNNDGVLMDSGTQFLGERVSSGDRISLLQTPDISAKNINEFMKAASNGSVMSVADLRAVVVPFVMQDNSTLTVYSHDSRALISIHRVLQAVLESNNYNEWLHILSGSFSGREINEMRDFVSSHGINIEKEFTRMQSFLESGRIQFYLTEMMQQGIADEMRALRSTDARGNFVEGVQDVTLVNIGGRIQTDLDNVTVDPGEEDEESSGDYSVMRENILSLTEGEDNTVVHDNGDKVQVTQGDNFTIPEDRASIVIRNSSGRLGRISLTELGVWSSEKLIGRLDQYLKKNEISKIDKQKIYVLAELLRRYEDNINLRGYIGSAEEFRYLSMLKDEILSLSMQKDFILDFRKSVSTRADKARLSSTALENNYTIISPKEGSDLVKITALGFVSPESLRVALNPKHLTMDDIKVWDIIHDLERYETKINRKGFIGSMHEVETANTLLRKVENYTTENPGTQIDELTSQLKERLRVIRLLPRGDVPSAEDMGIWGKSLLETKLKALGIEPHGRLYEDFMEQLQLYESRLNDRDFHNNIGEYIALTGLKEKLLQFITQNENLTIFRTGGLTSRLWKRLAGAATHEDILSVFATIDRQITARITALTVEVPKNINFVWIGRIGQVQKEYMELWAKVNEEYTTSLWFDSGALLSHEFSKRIKEFAAAISQNPTANVDNMKVHKYTTVLELQNEAYAFISREINAGSTYDEAAAKFMVQELGVKAEEIEQIRLNNLDSFMSTKEFFKERGIAFILRDVQDLLESSWLGSKQHYIQELALRGNLAAATDMLRLIALSEDGVNGAGGFYFDPDLIPLIKEGNIITDPKFIQEIHEIREKVKYRPHALEYFISELALDAIERSNPGMLTTRTKSKQNYTVDSEQKLRNAGHQELVEYLKKAFEESSLGLHDVFEDLGTQHRPKGGLRFWLTDKGILRGTDFANGALVAADAQYMIARQLEQIKARYQYMETYGVDMGLSVTSEFVRDIDTYYKSVMTEKQYGSCVFLEGYRADGLVAGSKTTLELSLKPVTLLDELVKENYAVGYSGATGYQVYPQEYDYQLFGINDATLFTMEDMNHSWLGDYTTSETKLFRETTRYKTQLVLQLSNDEQVTKAAVYLNRKHENRSQRLVWSENSGTFEVVPSSGENVVLGADSRIIVVGHGEGSEGSNTLSGFVAHRLFEELKKFIPDEGIKKVSLVGCRLDAAVSLDNPEAFLENGFAVKLMQELIDGNVKVGSISTRTSLVQVDILGRKWYGRMGADGNIAWSRTSGAEKVVITSDAMTKKVIFEHVPVEHGAVVEMSIAPRGGAVLNGERITLNTVWDNNVFSNAVIENSSLARGDNMSVLLGNRDQQGSVISVADQNAIMLAFVMHEDAKLVVWSNQPDTLLGVHKVLRAVFLSDNYAECRNILEREFSAMELRSLHALLESYNINFKDNFDNIKSFVSRENVSFHLTDLSQNGLADDVRSSTWFSGLDSVISDTRAIQAGRDVSIVNMGNVMVNGLGDADTERSNSLREGIESLMRGQEREVLFENESGRSIISADHNIKLPENFNDNRSVQQRRETEFTRSSRAARKVMSAALKSQMFERASDLVNKFINSQPISDKEIWTPLLDQVERTSEGQYRLPIIDPYTEEKIFLITDDPVFVDITTLLQEELREVVDDVRTSRAYERDQVNSEIPEGEWGGMLNTSFLVQTAILHFMGSNHHEKDPSSKNFKTAMKVYQYVLLAEMAYGLISDAAQVVGLIRTILESEVAATKAATSAATQAVKSIGLGLIGVGIAAVNVGFDIYLLTQANSEIQRATLAVQLSFDIVGLGIAIGALVATIVGAAAVASVLAGAGVIVAGLAIGVVALVGGYMRIAAGAYQVGDLFQDIFDAYASSSGSYRFDEEHKIFIQKSGIVIDEVDLSKGKDEICKLGSQYIYKTSNKHHRGHGNRFFVLPNVWRRAKVNLRETWNIGQYNRFFDNKNPNDDEYSSILLPYVVPYNFFYYYHDLAGATKKHHRGFKTADHLSRAGYHFRLWGGATEYITNILKPERFSYVDKKIVTASRGKSNVFVSPLKLDDNFKNRINYHFYGRGGKNIIVPSYYSNFDIKVSDDGISDWTIDLSSDAIKGTVSHVEANTIYFTNPNKAVRVEAGNNVTVINNMRDHIWIDFVHNAALYNMINASEGMRNNEELIAFLNDCRVNNRFSVVDSGTRVVILLSYKKEQTHLDYVLYDTSVDASRDDAYIYVHALRQNIWEKLEYRERIKDLHIFIYQEMGQIWICDAHTHVLKKVIVLPFYTDTSKVVGMNAYDQFILIQQQQKRIDSDEHFFIDYQYVFTQKEDYMRMISLNGNLPVFFENQTIDITVELYGPRKDRGEAVAAIVINGKVHQAYYMVQSTSVPEKDRVLQKKTVSLKVHLEDKVEVRYYPIMGVLYELILVSNNKPPLYKATFKLGDVIDETISGYWNPTTKHGLEFSIILNSEEYKDKYVTVKTLGTGGIKIETEFAYSDFPYNVIIDDPRDMVFANLNQYKVDLLESEMKWIMDSLSNHWFTDLYLPNDYFTTPSIDDVTGIHVYLSEGSVILAKMKDGIYDITINNTVSHDHFRQFLVEGNKSFTNDASRVFDVQYRDGISYACIAHVYENNKLFANMKRPDIYGGYVASREVDFLAYPHVTAIPCEYDTHDIEFIYKGEKYSHISNNSTYAKVLHANLQESVERHIDYGKRSPKITRGFNEYVINDDVFDKLAFTSTEFGRDTLDFFNTQIKYITLIKEDGMNFHSEAEQWVYIQRSDKVFCVNVITKLEVILDLLPYPEINKKDSVRMFTYPSGGEFADRFLWGNLEKGLFIRQEVDSFEGGRLPFTKNLLHQSDFVKDNNSTEIASATLFVSRGVIYGEKLSLKLRIEMLEGDVFIYWNGEIVRHLRGENQEDITLFVYGGDGNGSNSLIVESSVQSSTIKDVSLKRIITNITQSEGHLLFYTAEGYVWYTSGETPRLYSLSVEWVNSVKKNFLRELYRISSEVGTQGSIWEIYGVMSKEDSTGNEKNADSGTGDTSDNNNEKDTNTSDNSDKYFKIWLHAMSKMMIILKPEDSENIRYIGSSVRNNKSYFYKYTKGSEGMYQQDVLSLEQVSRTIEGNTIVGSIPVIEQILDITKYRSISFYYEQEYIFPLIALAFPLTSFPIIEEDFISGDESILEINPVTLLKHLPIVFIDYDYSDSMMKLVGFCYEDTKKLFRKSAHQGEDLVVEEHSNQDYIARSDIQNILSMGEFAKQAVVVNDTILREYHEDKTQPGGFIHIAFWVYLDDRDNYYKIPLTGSDVPEAKSYNFSYLGTVNRLLVAAESGEDSANDVIRMYLSIATEKENDNVIDVTSTTDSSSDVKVYEYSNNVSNKQSEWSYIGVFELINILDDNSIMFMGKAENIANVPIIDGMSSLYLSLTDTEDVSLKLNDNILNFYNSTLIYIADSVLQLDNQSSVVLDLREKKFVKLTVDLVGANQEHLLLSYTLVDDVVTNENNDTVDLDNAEKETKDITESEISNSRSIVFLDYANSKDISVIATDNSSREIIRYTHDLGSRLRSAGVVNIDFLTKDEKEKLTA